MTFAKISAGTGYLYLVRHTALGDAEPSGERDAAAYYAAQGNPPGRWTGRGAPLLGLAGRTVTEEQMRALFGLGEHPDMDAIVDAYIDERWRPWMTGERWDRLVGDAIRQRHPGPPVPRVPAAGPVRRPCRSPPGRHPGRRGPRADRGRGRPGEGARKPAASAPPSPASTWSSPRSSRPPCCGQLDERPRVPRGASAAAHEAAKDAALAAAGRARRVHPHRVRRDRPDRDQRADRGRVRALGLPRRRPEPAHPRRRLLQGPGDRRAWRALDARAAVPRGGRDLRDLQHRVRGRS